MKQLDVNWKSQLSSTASYGTGDCGEACLSMLLEYNGITRTVDELSKQLPYPVGFKYSTTEDVVNLGNKNGLPMKYKTNASLEDLKSFIDEGKPVIVLVKYQSLGVKFDKKYDANHFILIVGYDEDYFYYHDSYWKDETKSKYTKITYKELEYAWRFIYTEFGTKCVVAYQVDLPHPAKYLKNDDENYAKLMTEIRYFMEDTQRALEAQNYTSALEGNARNITRAYELENKLKGK